MCCCLSLSQCTGLHLNIIMVSASGDILLALLLTFQLHTFHSPQAAAQHTLVSFCVSNMPSAHTVC